MMNPEDVRLIAFDLDGTLTQHKTPLSPENKAVLDALGRRYALLMVGAGMCPRIFEQMGHYPIDILGNYGMQYAEYCSDGTLEIVENTVLPCDRPSVEERATALRKKYGYTAFSGDNVEYHASGCVTIPLLGTAAVQADKLAFDPDRSKRRAIYEDVKTLFRDYNVFIGGSSSFDMAPAPYDKAYALGRYCDARQIPHQSVVYVGDDYGQGGNDESVYLSDFRFLKIESYTDFPTVIRNAGLL